MNQIERFQSYLLVTILTALIPTATVVAQIKVSVTNYPGTSKKMVEYQYVSQEAGKVSNIEYRDGQTKQLTAVDNSTYSGQVMIPHGYRKEYYENGKLKSLCNFERGTKNGAASTYYENGKLETQGSYKNGVWDGEYSEFYDNGTLTTKSTYMEGIRKGQAIVFSPDGTEYLHLTYSDPVASSKASKYADGKLVRIMAEARYPNGKISEQGYLETFYSQKAFQKMYYDEDFTREGIWAEYNEAGAKTAEYTFKNSQLDGPSFTYYPNGIKKEEFMYKQATYAGETISVIDGPYKMYFESGKIAKSGTMRTLVTRSKDNAEELETQEYNADDWRRYNENGKLVEFTSLGRGDEVQLQMNEQEIERQQGISDQLEFAEYKQLSIEKFTKYFQFHYGETMQAIATPSVKENVYIINRIKVASMQVFDEYVLQLSGSKDKSEVKMYIGKLSNIITKLEEVSKTKDLTMLNIQFESDGVRNALKI